jgi:hypothetical protein
LEPENNSLQTEEYRLPQMLDEALAYLESRGSDVASFTYEVLWQCKKHAMFYMIDYLLIVIIY